MKSTWKDILRCGIVGLLMPLGLAATAEAPKIEGISMTYQLRIRSDTQVSNVIQFANSVGSTQWTSMARLWITNSPYVFQDPLPAGTKRFYRVMVPKADPIPPELVLIPAGWFQMGDSYWVPSQGNLSVPVHSVFVSAFYMETNVVSTGLWDRVHKWGVSNGYRFTTLFRGKAENHPIICDYWFDVVVWCNARSEMEGRVPAYYTDASQTKVLRSWGSLTKPRNDWVRWNAGYRLPTEAEWEKAARGGLDGKRFPFGDTISHSQANYVSSSGFNYDVSPTRGKHPIYMTTGNSPGTSPVGSFAPNGYGLYDMAGNVWEWCWDWFSFYTENPEIDPRGRMNQVVASEARVLRGGSYMSLAQGCQVSFRLSDGSDASGFRCVLAPGQ